MAAAPPRPDTIVVASALCIALVTIERTVGWPDWLRVDRTPVRVPPR